MTRKIGQIGRFFRKTPDFFMVYEGQKKGQK